MADAPMGIALRQIQRLFDEGTIAGLPDSQLLERFLTRGDDAAFAALVRRHGPMVMGTCRAVLLDLNDAEDAFQATFLVLICKARSIRGGDTLGTWLHRVAYRIAIQASADTARRRECERNAGTILADECPSDPLGDDGRQVLYEELARLSEKYRLPVLLCDLEGKSYSQAAAELNWGEATVRRRLAGARELLRSRLGRRGVALTAGGLALALGRSAGAAVPSAWVEATVKAVGHLSSRAARIAVGDIISATVADLARKSLRTMLLGQLRAAATSVVFLVALAGIAWGVGTYGQDESKAARTVRNPGPQMAASDPRSQVKTAAPDDPNGTITYHGQVLDPEGRPVAGAELYLVRHNMNISGAPRLRATSGPDGRFRFVVAKAEFDLSFQNTYARDPWKTATMLARAPGYAFGLTDHGDSTKESTLRLVKDDLPITGRIIDLEGRSVVGATVKVLSVRLPVRAPLAPGLKALQLANEVMPPKGPVDAWFKNIADLSLGAMVKDAERQREVDIIEYPYLPNHLEGLPEPVVIPDRSTGPDGRFRITGVGRGRVVILQIQGPNIETRQVRVRTHHADPIRLRGTAGRGVDNPTIIYGASFEHIAGPTRAIEGVVRDRQSGHPLAGVVIKQKPSLVGEFLPYVETTTDSLGRYRLVGLPLGREGDLQTRAPSGQSFPYFNDRVPVGHPPGVASVHLDFNLKRGVFVTGRVIDRATGKPVQATVSYFVFDDNPNFKDGPSDIEKMDRISNTGPDGSFRLIAFPGPGLLAVHRIADGRYRVAAGLDAIKDKRKDWDEHVYPLIRSPMRFHVLHQIGPEQGTSSMIHDLPLEPADRKP